MPNETCMTFSFCFVLQFYLPTLPSCSNDSRNYMKGMKIFHQRMEPIAYFAFLFLLSVKDRKLLHSDLHTLFSWDFPFLYHLLPSVPQDSEYVRTWPKIVSLQKCISSHQEVKGFCSEPNIHWWKFYFKHLTVQTHMLSSCSKLWGWALWRARNLLNCSLQRRLRKEVFKFILRRMKRIGKAYSFSGIQGFNIICTWLSQMLSYSSLSAKS